MRRALLLLAALVLFGAAVAWSGPRADRPEFDFALEKTNPVTHLKLENDPAEFQFAIVSDRTGGQRAKVFSRAVEQLNLMQPEFVVSVGDLIDGYTTNKDEIAKQWREFQGYVSRLQMPFFYVPGNHDLANKTLEVAWKEKFGRSHYEFVYRDVLFLSLNSEDVPGHEPGTVSAPQLAWLEKTLADNASARWTLVFVHRPMWIEGDPDKTGWAAVEKLLAGRKHTVFAGHVHRYQKFVRNGANYYMLATTGGGSRLRGVEYGEFDHIGWVKMKKTGPVFANILLDGILREDLARIPTDEEGVKRYFVRPTYPVEAKVFRQGKPLAGAYVVLRGIGKEPRQPRADGIVEEDGRLRLSTYGAFDGVPAETYGVTVELRQPMTLPDGSPGKNVLPAKYADPKTTPLKIIVKAGVANTMTIDLED
jgi:hypothetical protein